MTYVFDTSPFSTLFKNYYPARFPSLWKLFDGLVQNGDIVSTREVQREIEDGPVEAARLWAASNASMFPTPIGAEGLHVAEIYKVPHFQANIEQQKILKGGRNADPFVIARALSVSGIVVTLELFKPNAAKIPNICQHFDVECLTLEEFMEKENWSF